MKCTLLRFLAILAALGIMLTIAFFVHLPLPPYLDFQVLYLANQGILQGIPLYDRAGQAQMIAAGAGVSVDRVFVLPFPYPPWYAVVTLPLALLPIEVAARMWFLLNIAMLLVSVWLLTENWEPRKRLYSFIAAPLFLPVFGALFVGQYVFPTILGMALLIYALRYQRVKLTALGMALVTFKPHVGVLVLLTSLAYLLLRRDGFGRRAFWATALTGISLFAIGFLGDNQWPVAYLRSLFAFRDVSECKLCVSLPMMIANLVGLGFDQAMLIAGVLLLALSGLFLRTRPREWKDAGWVVAASTIVALLVNPYLQNYDFAFLITPFFLLAGTSRSRLEWLWLGLAFIVPWLGLGLFERAGNHSLLFSTLVLAAMMYRLDACNNAA